MIDPRDLFESLSEAGVRFYAGVPDSLLKEFCAYVTDHQPNHVIAANEGGAIALATGHYLATGELALVYMQNSGIGNAANPLASLADPAVNGIPMLLMVGWRGEPGKKDEPQHVKQGAITTGLMVTLGIPYAVIDVSTENIEAVTRDAATIAVERSGPYALIVREKTFSTYALQSERKTDYALTREAALKIVLDKLGDTTAIVSTTGMASREIFEHREHSEQDHARDFLMVGSMGHASQVALGIALANQKQEVCCVDGDGAAIMHLGALAIIGSLAPANYRHVIVNNGAHDSVGGQPTAAFDIDLTGIASACGYKACVVAETAEEIASALETLLRLPGPTLLEIRVNKGNRSDLGRPTITPTENKASFMEFLRR